MILPEVKPALTREEWEIETHDWETGLPPLPRMVTEYSVELLIAGRKTTPEERNHAMAAMCLHGQSFGFSWEDVDVLRHEATYLHEAANRGAKYPVVSEYGADLESLADRIACLLPPREQP